MNNQNNNQNFIEQQNTELDINKKNRENYENLMQDSSTNLDGYWDKNNAFVKLILLILGIVIIVGAGYYICVFLGSK